MAYAQLPDLKARAGTLASAWSASTVPGDSELELFLQQTSGELDAWIGGAGYPVPITDDVAAAALVGVNADFALLLAIDATWPGTTGDVQDLRDQVWARVQAYRQAMADGDFGAILYLGATSAATGGASNYWSKDALQYEYWNRYASAWYGYPRWLATDPHGVPISQGPRFNRTMRL